MPPALCASIVVYDSEPTLLARTLEALDCAIARAEDARLIGTSTVVVVANDAPAAPGAEQGERPSPPTSFAPRSHAGWLRRAGQGNVGFGRGHNLALLAHDADFHLVLNPDAVLAPDALERGIDYLNRTSACGLAAPYASGPDGAPQFLCKRYPDLVTLFLRAAMPALARRRAASRMSRYELRDVVGEDASMPALGVPLASGACMLLTRDAVRRTGGFDPRFFVYFEDYDLSLRLAAGGASRIDYVPAMKIVHHGGNAARKSLAHIRMFATGAFRFFMKHGWKLA
jgi:GT2 family glycosyltransferase